MAGQDDRELRPSNLGSAMARAVEEQRAFEMRRPTRLGRGAERITAPLGGALARLVPPHVVKSALARADDVAGLTVPQRLKGHSVDDLAACDAAALRAQAWAQGSNAATGGVAGFYGLAGLALDIPATIGLAARSVRATGLAYGFAGDDEGERAFRLAVLEVATSLASQTREDSLERLNGLARQLSRPEVKLALEVGGDWVIEKVADRLARQMGTSLAGRKLGQVVPVIGGAVAAAVNASFQADVARAARYAYRQRWLMTRQVLAAPAEADPKED